MAGISKERRIEILMRYGGLGGDEIDLILKNRDSELIMQLVNSLTQKAELEEIEEIDLEDVASIVAEYFPLMSFQPEACLKFLEENLI